MNNLMQTYQQFMKDPVKILSQRFNIPEKINTPNDIIQYLLNTGQVTQAQVNNAMNMRNNPMIKQLMGGNNGRN